MRRKKTYEELLSLDKVKRELREYVIFVYEEEYFPGKIISFDDNNVEISSMQYSLKSWTWLMFINMNEVM